MRPARALKSATSTMRIAAIVTALTVAAATAGCSIQIQSKPDPSIGADTMLVAADNGSPMFERNFNPYLANTRIAAKYMYEPLVVVNNLDGAAHPWLATSYSLPDAQTVNFTIRKGVTWSDGTKFTPADVVFTFDLLKKYPTLDITGIWQYIDTVETHGDVVTVHLKGPDSPAALIIAQVLIVPKHIWKDVAKPDTWRDPNPVGTGPYTLGNFFPQQYSLDRNASYWQADKVAVKHLVLPASNTQLDVVTKGYDWAYSFISDVDGTWVAANKNNTYWFPPGGTIALFPNLTKAPFTNVDFRRGLSLALDRTAIGDAAAEGYMQPAGQSGLLLPAQQKLLNPALPDSGLVTQNTADALASFAAAGYTQQGGKLVDASGKQASLTIVTANGYTDWLRGVQQVEKELSAVGIKVEVSQPQPAAYQLALRNGDFDLVMSGYGGTGSVYQDFNNLLSSEFLKPVGTEASNNFERYSDPTVDRLLTDYKTTTDAAKQKQIGFELQKVMYDQLPIISLYYGGSWGLFSTQKFTGWPSAKDPYASPKTYDSTPLLIFTHLKKSGGEK
ncbi:MAG TPA: ABC transporter substrate-binding protein [Lacisediminihabitans sp.]